MRIDVLAALALAAGAAATPASAADSFDGCAGRTITSLPASITKAGRWCLAGDHSTAIATGAAIQIAANNVVLDCNGFRIEGNAPRESTQATGVQATGRNITLRGCRVAGFATGLRVSGDAALVEGARLHSQQRVGISVTGDGGLVRDNRVERIGDLDDLASEAPRTTVGIIVQGTTDVLDNTVDGVINRGSAVGERAYGIQLASTRGTTVARNRVRVLYSTHFVSNVGIRIGGASQGVRVLDNDLHSTGIGVLCATTGSATVIGTSVLDPDTRPIVRCNDGGGNVRPDS